MGFLNFFKAGNSANKLKSVIEEVLYKPVSEIMSKYVISIQKTDKLSNAAEIIVGEKVSCVVVKDGDIPVGVVTERDLLKKAPVSTKGINELKVSHLMSPKLVTIKPDTIVAEAINILVKNNFRKLVVMNEREMVGIVTQTDFVRLFDKIYDVLDIKTSDLMDISEIMTKNVLTVNKTARFIDAKKKMSEKEVGSIIVMDKNNIAGILTEYDIAAKIVECLTECEISTIEKMMISPVMTIYGDTNIFEANRLMVIDNVRRLPIVEDGELKGIVTQTDICRAIFYFLKATLLHMRRGDLKTEKLIKKEVRKTLI
ncbi:MAG: CBS domain-containing protein [archaeon]